MVLENYITNGAWEQRKCFKNISETDTISDVQKETVDISLEKKNRKACLANLTHREHIKEERDTEKQQVTYIKSLCI